MTELKQFRNKSLWISAFLMMGKYVLFSICYLIWCLIRILPHIPLILFIIFANILIWWWMMTGEILIEFLIDTFALSPVVGVVVGGLSFLILSALILLYLFCVVK